MVDLTDEWLKNHPDVRYVEYTTTEKAGFAIKIAQYMAQKPTTPPPPKPACHETCKSCRKDRDTKTNTTDAELKECKQEHERDAQVSCQTGIWRNDPRHACSAWEELTDGYYCGEPGTPVQADDCTNYIEVQEPGRPPHMEQVCEMTNWMKDCINSYMLDQPATSTGHTGGSTTIGDPWGIVSHTFGTDTISTSTTPTEGYNTACLDLVDKWRKKVREDFKDCKKRVQAANPGVQCADH